MFFRSELSSVDLAADEKQNSMIPELRATLVNLIFPPECSFCAGILTQTEPHLLCAPCNTAITKDSAKDFCYKCGFVPNRSIAARDCPECKKRRFRFDRVVPLGRYEGELRSVVIRMKNSSQYPLARSIGGLLADQVRNHTQENLPDLVVPMPKYWLKRLRFGVNSAEMLANEIAAKFGIPTFPKAVHWRRSIRKQSLLSVSERQTNVHNAISIAKGYNFQSAHALLVDDTMTTGATANEAARALRKAGANRITVGVVARTLDS